MTRILVVAVLRTAAIVLPALAIAVLVALGREHAIGVLVGGVLALLSGLGIVYLTGELLDPVRKTNKVVLVLVLLFKLVFVVVLLWAALSVWSVSGLGVILGIGAGLGALVLGVSRGSSSPEAKRAMDEAEARIREELGDNEADSG
jgi:hypothetical protein